MKFKLKVNKNYLHTIRIEFKLVTIIEESIRLKDPQYLNNLAIEREKELKLEQEEQIIREINHQRWIALEAIAQKIFIEKRSRLEKLEKARELERQLVVEEFEKQRKCAELQKKRQLEEQQRYEQFQIKLSDYIIGTEDNLPNEFFESAETNPGKTICGFFENSAACRFGDRCSRNHVRPGVTNMILIRNFFVHARLDCGSKTEYGSDLYLEYDDSELQTSFSEFYNDVIPEFENIGEIHHFVVSSNYEPHLRGNVYIEYKSVRYNMFNLKLIIYNSYLILILKQF